MVAVAGDQQESGVSSLLQAIQTLDITEKSANEEAEEQDTLIDISYSCMCQQDDHVDLIFEIKPKPPLVDDYGVPLITTGRTKKAAVRLMLVFDVSHSMSEPFSENEGDLSKLERVKIFATLLVRQFPENYQLGIVAFGTHAKVISPLRKMTEENKEETITAISEMEVGGVTNLSDGLFLAQDQFVHITYGIRRKGPAYDDNMVLFTDGMANEGVVNSEELISEFRQKTHRLQEEYRYPEGYAIRLCTLGTGGFMPNLIYDLGQEFSSDAFYFLDSSSNLEVNLFRSIYLRSVTFVHRIQIKIRAFNGVCLDFDKDPVFFSANIGEIHRTDSDEEMNFFLYDLCEDSSRHLPISITLPHKHKKKLKGLDCLQVEIQFQDRALRPRTVHHTVAYAEIPKKPKQNIEEQVIYITKHESRFTAVKALNEACDSISRLKRTEAAEALSLGINKIQNEVDMYHDTVTKEELFEDLSSYTRPILENLENAESLLEDFSLKWDDAWGRMKALASSLARETPTCIGVYAPGAEMYDIRDMQKKMDGICMKLREYYRSRGLNTKVIDSYVDVIREMEERWNKIDFRDDEGPIVCFNLKIN